LEKSRKESLLLFFLIFFVQAGISVGLFLVFLSFFFLFIIIGENDDVHWMGLRHFELDVAFRAAQNLAFFHFVFVQVDLSVAFWAFGHVDFSCSGGLSPESVLYNARVKLSRGGRATVTGPREYPGHPIVGVGGVVISDGRALLIRRGSPPLVGQWSIPGGMLEVGETLLEGVRRELREETGVEVRVLDLIEVFERIELDVGGKPRYHYVILDYLCEAVGGEPCAGSDVTAVAWATPAELERYSLTPTATRVIQRAFEMARQRGPALEERG
jgi:8-oxo-dGTP diphosphatase